MEGAGACEAMAMPMAVQPLVQTARRQTYTPATACAWQYKLVAAVSCAVACASSASAGGSCAGELLYNGICLPREWPPRLNYSRSMNAHVP